MPENQKSEKGDYLTKDEMMSFLKSKGIIIDPKTRNFLRFAKSNGIIYKIVERVGSAGHVPAVYKKPNKDKIIEILKSEKIISLISDAGTPAISDPGRIVINECVKNKINIYPIPGPSAVSTAVSVSGFSEKYFFYGFFPQKKKDLLNDLKNLSNIDGSIIFFISPNKINDSIEHIKAFFSGRKILICREMTKFFEEYIRADVDDLKPFQKIPKGELTLVISENNNNLITLNDLDKRKIKKMIQNSSIKDIVDLITKEKKISKKEVYNYCLTIKK